MLVTNSLGGFRRSMIAAAVVLGASLPVAATAAAPDMLSYGPYEKSGHLSALETLPADLRSGPLHTVTKHVMNDGFMNRYMVNSKFGRFHVTGLPRLKSLVTELEALDVLDAAINSEDFQKGLEKTDNGPDAEFKSFVFDQSKSGHKHWRHRSSVASIYQAMGDLMNQSRIETDDPMAVVTVGFQNERRLLARGLGVDPFTQNRKLAARLDLVAWVIYGSVLTVDTVLGDARQEAPYGSLAEELIGDLNPFDLRNANAFQLGNLRLGGDIVDALVENQAFSPSAMAYLSQAMAAMEGIQGLPSLAKVAAAAGDPETASYRQRQVEMFSNYHQNVAPIKILFAYPPFVGAQTESGKVILAMPFDHVTWNESFATIMIGLSDLFTQFQGFSGMELWLSGTISELAKGRIEGFGWVVQESGEARLLGE